MPGAPSLVLFDLDDTLFAHRNAVSAGILAHRLHHGGALGAADSSIEDARWNELEERHYHRYLAGELDFVGQRRARAREFVEPFGLDLGADHLADEWFDRYFDHYVNAWMLHEDALACLDSLGERGIRLGIITNGDAAFQGNKIAKLGLTDRFEHVIASGDLGFAKPDPRIFHHACELFGVAPKQSVYVGDRLETDAIGAADAGLTGVWLDRNRVGTPEQLARAASVGGSVIHTLDELPALLAP
ncbi:MAG: HAD family hydrolase [Rhodoglobus sp.]